MTCADCGAEGADCLTADRVRVWSDCLYDRVVKERDEARAENVAAVEAFHEATRLRSRIQQARIKAENERDAALAEVTRLRGLLTMAEDEAVADDDRGRREALAQKIQVLLDERRQLRARLVECRPWVGVCPFPNQPGFDEMLAIRDLADDTLKEVQP